MKNAMIAWLLARFTERSSAIGIGALVTSGWGLYAALGAHDQQGTVEAIVGLLFGLVAFVTHDGHVLDFLGEAQSAARARRGKS